MNRVSGGKHRLGSEIDEKVGEAGTARQVSGASVAGATRAV